MKRYKFFVSGLALVLIFTSCAVSCSKTKENTDVISEETSQEEVKETEVTETADDGSGTPVPEPVIMAEFKGEIEVSSETPDLYTESDNLNENFEVSDDYGYIYPYAADRAVVKYVNYKAIDPNASDEFYADLYGYNCGFCTGDGTIITKPLYGIEALYKELPVHYDQREFLLYKVTDDSEKSFLVNSQGSKKTETFDICQVGTFYHKDWIFCYNIVNDKTELTIFDKDLNTLYDKLVYPMSMLVDDDGITKGRKIGDFLDEDHIILIDLSGWGSDIYNRKTGEMAGLSNVYNLGSSVLASGEYGANFLADFDGNPITPAYDVCEFGHNEYSYVPFSNYSDPDHWYIYDVKGNLLAEIDSTQMLMAMPGDILFIQTEYRETEYELYDKNMNYIETVEGYLSGGPGDNGKMEYYLNVPDEKDEYMLDCYLVNEIGDGLYSYDDGFIKEVIISEDEFMIFPQFGPDETVNGLLGLGLIDGKYIQGIMTETDFISTETGIHYRGDDVVDFVADGYDAINTDTGLHLIGQTDPSIFATVRDDEGNIIFGINSMPLIYTDPVTGYHYIFWNTKGNDSGFIMPGDYDFMSVSGFNMIYCLEQGEFINLDYPTGYTSFSTILNSKIVLAVNNSSVPFDIQSYSSTPLNINDKGFNEIYNLADPSDPILKFHYTQEDHFETRDLAEEWGY